MPIRLGWFCCIVMPWLAACGSEAESDEPSSLPHAPSAPSPERAKVGDAAQLPPSRPASGTAAVEPGPRESEIRASDEAKAEPLGFRPAYCAGRRTSRIEVAGTLEAAAERPEWWTWNPAWPYSSMYFTVFDGPTRAEVQLQVEPAPQDPLVWHYHVVLNDTLLEVGSGELDFDTSGALVHHEVIAPVVLPSGEPWPIDLWLGSPTDAGGSGRDGMVAMSDSMSFTRLTFDGEARGLGAPCIEAKGAPPTQKPPACAAAATTFLRLRANLEGDSPVAGEPWNGLEPARGAAFQARVYVYDEDGSAAGVELGT